MTGVTCLSCMLLDNNEEIVELLIKLGAEVNFENHLKAVFKEGSSKCIEVLLKNGVKIDGPKWQGKSVAEAVLSRNDNVDNRIEILKLLFRYGLSVDFENPEGENLLHAGVRMDVCN